MPFERYRETVDYLERRLWHDLPIMPVERAMQSRINRLLEHLDNPQRKMPIVYVGGSAGKGSTATMIAAILTAARHKTGLYTSPHLQTFIERVSVDGTLIAPDTFADSVLGLDPLVRQMHVEVLDGIGFGRPSLVEVAFAAGMRHFAADRCHAAVIEVGLGGRTDCTNVFDRPAATVITGVELEHRDRLGPDIASIAREKAAIIKGGIVMSGARRRDARAVIEARCGETKATLWQLGREIRIRIRAAESHGSVIDVRTPHGSIVGARLSLAGAHQARNAALAVAAAQAFASETGLHLDDDAIKEGLASARLSGRMEVVQREPTVLLDSAHNPAETRALATALRTLWLRRGMKLILVAGILADKQRRPMVSALAEVADRVIVTQPPLEQRAGDARDVAGMFAGAVGKRRVTLEPEPQRALGLALAVARPTDLVCVTGSMFLVGALRARWVPEQCVLERRSAAI